MKRKVKKFAEGGTNVRTRTDEEFAEDSKFGGYGKYMPKTKSYSMDDVKSGIGKLLGGKSSPSEDRPTSSGVEDYASMGKRAPAKSTWSGEDMSPRLRAAKEETEEAPTGIASGFKSGESKFVRNDNEVKMPLVKKKPNPRYSGVVSSEDLGSQDFSSKAKPKPTGDSGLSKATLAAGLGLAGAAGAGLLAGRRRMQSGTRGERIEPTMGSTRSPVRGMTAEEAAFENEGGRAFKKGGKTKKMASGGSASSRGDGIAQRGKTKGRIC